MVGLVGGMRVLRDVMSGILGWVFGCVVKRKGGRVFGETKGRGGWFGSLILG